MNWQRERLAEMFGLLTRLRACTKGSPAVEFALLAPILVVVMMGLIDLSLMLADATALKKAVRAGAVTAARSPIDKSGGTPTFTATIEGLIACVVKTGVPPTSGTTCDTSKYLLPGWSEAEASVQVIPRFDTLADGTTQVAVIQIIAHVPFVFLVEGFLPYPTLEAIDEQVHISD